MEAHLTFDDGNGHEVEKCGGVFIVFAAGESRPMFRTEHQGPAQHLQLQFDRDKNSSLDLGVVEL